MKQITMTTLGTNGRLGNQLFQYASLIGLARKYDADLRLGPWKYAQYFDSSFPENKITCPSVIDVHEPVFNYIEDWPHIRTNECTNIKGYLQSEKYWRHCEQEVRSSLRFKSEFTVQCRSRFKEEKLKDAIAISIRRGDYVNNPNYQQLPIVSYFICALFEHFPDWRQRNIVVFSDDIAYCRVHFGTLDNVSYSENNSDIEDICLMSQCKDFILSNSTFSWWGAYLCDRQDKKVIRPVKVFDGPLAKSNIEKDFWPEDWIPFDYKVNGVPRKLDLQDVVFTIPVSYDHQHRSENFELCLAAIRKDFDTFVMVFEQYTYNRIFERYSNVVDHYQAAQLKHFHRTHILNRMAWLAPVIFGSKYVFNWDADVFVPPLQVYEAVHMLRRGYDMVYPYKWAFARLPREVWYERLKRNVDIGIVGDTRFNGMNAGDWTSYGGAVGFNIDSFKSAGGENENFISYGPEDSERFERFRKLGYKIGRVKGETLYHLNHYIGPDSSPRNPHFERNTNEFKRIKEFSAHQLREYIKNWKR